jgi:ABC-2 type transport system ATP-binding protein
VGLIHKGKLIACDTPEGLKKLMRGTILEVRTGNPRRTARVLKERLPDASVGLFGDKVHVVTGEPDRVGDKVIEICEKEGLVLTGIRIIEPNMEDVFVSVMNREQR